MDKNTITGLALIALIVVGYFFVQKSISPEEPEAVRTEQTESRTKIPAPAVPDASQPAATQNIALPADWAAFSTGEDNEVTLENDKLIVKVSSKGGNISYVQLKGYKTYDGKPLILVTPESSQYSYQFSTGNEDISTADLYFKPENVSGNAVTMAVQTADGRAIKQTFRLKKGSYLVDNQLSLSGFDEVIPKKQMYFDLSWNAKMLQHELDSTVSYSNATIFYRQVDESTDYLSETSEEEELVKRKTDWVSFKQQFFCQTLISLKEPFINTEIATVNSTDTNYIKNLSARLSLPFSHRPVETYDMQVYYGPLSYKLLKKLDLDMERQVPLGWSFAPISWVNRFIVVPIFNFLNKFGWNFGIIILILTIFIKILVLPLTYKSYLSTAKMRLLKPDLDAIKEKHGGDMAKMQGDQMKLYRQAGVSPFGGCLPVLLQAPILIAMFRFFPSSIELRQESFLWAHDLSTYDSIATLPFKIPYYGDHVSLFTILMTISTLIYTRMNNSLNPQQNDFKWLSYIMPIFFLGFFNNYAAGLSLYYLFFNLLTFLQQYLFKVFINDEKLKAKLEANKKKAGKGPAKKSGFQKRLEDMSKRQQEMRKR